MPEISVIINCVNEARYLRQCLDSVFAQTFQDWEIVFWDNASTDGSGEIASSYGDKVRCFRSDTPVPLGLARKSAFEQTRGNYIAILDADDIWLPQKLDRQLALFHAHPRVGMTFCDSINFNDSGDHYRTFQRTKPHRGHVLGQLLVANFIASSALMFRRSVVEDLGRVFDEQYSRAPDYDLMLRIAYHYPVDYVSEPLCKWRMSEPDEKPWKKTLVSRIVEIKATVDNLLDIYPDIRTRYATELQLFNKTLDYNFGVTEWRNGNASEARNYFSRHLINQKFAFLYLCTLLMTYDWFQKLKLTYKSRITGH